MDQDHRMLGFSVPWPSFRIPHLPFATSSCIWSLAVQTTFVYLTGVISLFSSHYLYLFRNGQPSSAKDQVVEAISEDPGQSEAFIQDSCNLLWKTVIRALLLVISAAIAKTQFATHSALRMSSGSLLFCLAWVFCGLRWPNNI